MNYHLPVLLNESIDGLNIKPDGTYIDLTYGSGGHSKEILKRLGQGKILAFDQDEEAMQNIVDDERLILLNHNYRYMKNFLRLYHLLPVDGILADLGVSSHQLDKGERGFSTRYDGLLDMRMSRRIKRTAGEIINTGSREYLRHLFIEYGEIPNAAKLADSIIRHRSDTAIDRAEDFKKAIAGCITRGNENRYLAQVFQALRIEVNEELMALKEMLNQTLEVLRKGGRLVIISYHSLEDRIVKNFMRSGNFEGEINKDLFGHFDRPFQIITRKPIVANHEEILANSRSRSAKMRIAERT
ncbi:MAG: 16S rRNA (cytosine(1402)-N(4))-methyltransferase RsmH [Bacteroidetes bacterium]|nr:16S rRNA (cytosine(1402)-N(4))-methyltransferase RsmH [Bacteroidota bacterium]